MFQVARWFAPRTEGASPNSVNSVDVFSANRFVADSRGEATFLQHSHALSELRNW